MEEVMVREECVYLGGGDGEGGECVGMSGGGGGGGVCVKGRGGGGGGRGEEGEWRVGGGRLG